MLSEVLAFFNEIPLTMKETGAILPTASRCSKGFCSALKAYSGKKTILEVGPGTGSLTREILKILSKDDKLVLVEINPRFVECLKRKFELDPFFSKYKHQVEILNQDITKIEFNEKFNFILSTLPFSNFNALFVSQVLSVYKAILSEGGVLSYIEYAYLRKLKTFFSVGNTKKNIIEVQNILEKLNKEFLISRDTIVFNIPPAWFFTLRVGKMPTQDLYNFKPLLDRKRIRLPFVGGINQYSSPILIAYLLAFFTFIKFFGFIAVPILFPLFLFIIFFFRDPIRVNDYANRNVVLSPADGVVMGVEEISGPEFEGTNKWLRIKIFLSIFNVHVNYSPYWGEVNQFFYEKGGNNLAKSNASEKNNSLYTFFSGPLGPFIVAQRTGYVARRIVNWLSINSISSRGERFGLIRFGSRTDVYLPYNKVCAKVKVGDKVIGSITPVAEYIS